MQSQPHWMMYQPYLYVPDCVCACVKNEIFVSSFDGCDSDKNKYILPVHVRVYNCEVFCVLVHDELEPLFIHTQQLHIPSLLQ